MLPGINMSNRPTGIQVLALLFKTVKDSSFACHTTHAPASATASLSADLEDRILRTKEKPFSHPFREPINLVQRPRERLQLVSTPTTSKSGMMILALPRPRAQPPERSEPSCLSTGGSPSVCGIGAK